MGIEEYIRQTGKVVSFKSNQHVFQQGDQNTYLYFVKEGLLKAYYVTPDGKEFVKSFIGKNQIIGSIQSAFTETGCSFSLCCLKDCKLQQMDVKEIQKVSEENIEVANGVIQVLIDLAIKKEKREYEFLCLSPEERYLSLLNDNPDIHQQVTQNDMARYLGITPVALSRIKKRLISL